MTYFAEQHLIKVDVKNVCTSRENMKIFEIIDRLKICKILSSLSSSLKFVVNLRIKLILNQPEISNLEEFVFRFCTR